jgi:hypothetical protein
MVVGDCCLAQDRPSSADSLVVTGDPNFDGTLFDTLDFRVNGRWFEASII